MKKSLFTILLALLPLLASAAVEIDGIYYELFSSDIGDNTAIVAKKPSGSYTGNIVIPATVTYKDVVYDVFAIGDNAFAYCENMFSVSIPSSVTTIYSQAFLWCLSLTSVTIPESVTSIGDEAFKNCGMLRTINMPDNVPYIGSDVFYGTQWLDNQPDGVVYAGKVAYTYKGDEPIDGHLTLKKGTIGIARNAFSNSNFTSVTIPDGVGGSEAERRKKSNCCSQEYGVFHVEALSICQCFLNCVR